MSDHIQQTICEVQEQVKQLEGDLRHKKKMVNDLAELAGLSAVYQLADEQAPSVGSIRRDQWYGQPLSTAIREYLEMRKVANQGPASVNEVFTALTSGGYEFDAKDDANAKRGLRISLTKNTAIFHRMPDGKLYGLREWYPEVKEKKGKAKGSPAKSNGDENGDVPDSDDTEKPNGKEA